MYVSMRKCDYQAYMFGACRNAGLKLLRASKIGDLANSLAWIALCV